MMTNAQLATASLDDIVFDGRNRHYGAYELRALYQRHMSRALVIATAIMALILVFPLVAQLLAKAAPVAVPHPVITEVIRVDEGGEPPIVTPPPPARTQPATTPPQLPTVKNVVPVVAKEETVTKDEVPNQDELRDKKSGLANVEGDPNANINPPLEELKPGKGDEVLPDVSKPYTFVEQMPELPTGGGQLGIVAAIQKAVRYPSMALRNQVEGRVYVSFTVDPKGEVTDVKIVKGLGSGIDEETIRAIKTLPRFIPGKQNGREVSVSFTVPVTYKIQ
jgi:protein TonB